MSHDTLSDVLRSVRLRGAVFFYVSGNSDWAAEAPPAREIAPLLMRGVEHVIEYHAVAQGSCWAAIPGGPSVRLSAGDVVMFPHGDAHVVSSAPGMRGDAPDLRWFARSANDQLPLRVAYNGANAPSTAPLRRRRRNDDRLRLPRLRPAAVQSADRGLPRMLHLRAADDGGWIAQFTQQAVAESRAQRPGGEAMLARMSEMMFVDAVRRYAARLPPRQRRLARRPARPLRRPRAGADARAAGARLDDRRARPARRPVALGAARALRAADRRAADAVPRAVAHAGRGAPAARDARHRRRDRPRRRLRLRGGVRARLQAPGGQAARRLAARAPLKVA